MTIELRNINKSFTNKQVLQDVSFFVESGKTLGFLGRNGSGKTTTIRIIMNIISADSGEIFMDGKKFSRDDYKLGYLPEERGLYQKVAILDQMIYFGKLKGMTATGAKQAALSLLEKLDATEYNKRGASTLSKGNQQKIQLAIALINDPDILILDEPFSGLDPVNTKVLKDLIAENARHSKIILFSSHQLENVEEFCEDVCLIDNGKIILSGGLREIKDKYPKDKVLIVPDRDGEKRLENILNTNTLLNSYISKYERGKNGFIVTLKTVGAKAALLHKLTEDLDSVPLRSFSVMEPSLLDIFLEKVGGSNNEKN